MRLDARKLAVLAMTVLVLLAVYYGLDYFGVNPVTEFRCRSGAFVPRSANDVESDADGNPFATGGFAPHTGSQPTADTTGANLIPNPGLEEGIANPDGWLTNIYGQNDAAFTTVPGRASGRASRVEIRNYSGGTADWYYRPVEAVGGRYYQYRDHYRANVATRAVLMLSTSQGETQYIDLKTAAPSADWSEYTASFFVPQDAARLMVFRPLSTVGWLETDDHTLSRAQARGFARPLVTLTFDDGWKSIHENALPLMDRYGVPSTQYVVPGYLGRAKAYMTPVDVYDFQDRGHEVASHTVSHLDLTTVPASAVRYELEQSYRYLRKCFTRPASYAAPYGSDNEVTLRAIKDLHQTARSTDTGYNTADNLEPYRLQIQNVTAATSLAELQGWLELTKNNRAWLILVYHQVEDGPSDYARHPVDFERDLQAIRSSGIAVATIRDAHAEVMSQIR